MTNPTPFIVTVFLISYSCFSQNIDFTDPAFEKALLAPSLAVDLNGDGKIDVSEAENVGYLDISNRAISSISEIKYFTNLKKLNCAENNLDSLIIRNLTKLKMLNCASNELRYIELKNLIALENISLGNDKIPSVSIENCPKVAFQYGTAQTTPTTENQKFKNSLYFNAGTGVLWHVAAASYERTLKQHLFGKNIASFVKISGGYYLMWDFSPEYGGPFVQGHGGLLFGKKSHLFEVSAGPAYIFTGDFDGLAPSFNLGYRYQKKDQRFLFRAGLSFPEALYLGFGFRF